MTYANKRIGLSLFKYTISQFEIKEEIIKYWIDSNIKQFIDASIIKDFSEKYEVNGY